MDVNAAIQLEHVSVQLGDKSVLSDISVTINKGEFIAILGPNGAGKSTLLQVILGLIQPTEGTILVLGEKATKGNKGIGYSPQVKPFDADIPIIGKDYVKLGITGTKWGIPLQNKGVEEKVTRVLAEVDALTIAQKKLGKLSGGEQQRLSLAFALVDDPELLLLDEPLANLDISYQADILSRLSQYHKEHNHTILLVAHDVNPLLPYIDRVLYLANTHAQIGDSKEVITDECLSKLYGVNVHVFDIDGRLFVAADDGIVH